MITLVSAPSGDVVTLAKVKEYLREDDTAQDNIITGFILSSVEIIQALSGQKLLTQTWRQKQNNLKCTELQVYPVQSISNIKYFDCAGVQQTVDSSVYELVEELPSLIKLQNDQSWPEYDGRTLGVSIDIVAGYTSSELIPPEIITATMFLVGWFYENRQGGEIPISVLKAIMGAHIVTYEI